MYKLKHLLNTNSSKEVLAAVFRSDHEYEEILNILDIIQNNIQLVFVSLMPIVNYKVQSGQASS